MFPEQNIFCSDLLLSLVLPSSIVFMFGADHIFFLSHLEMEILNLTAYWMKKKYLEEGGVSLLCFPISFFFFLSHLSFYPFSYFISENGRKCGIWRKDRNNIYYLILSLRNWKKSKGLTLKTSNTKSTCHFQVSTVVLLINNIQPTNLCKIKMHVHCIWHLWVTTNIYIFTS